MSEIKLPITNATIRKLKYISKNISKLNVGNKNELWLATSGSGGGYDWSQFDVGINTKGEFTTCSQSGCSCNSPEAPIANDTLPLKPGLEIIDDSYDNPGTWLPELIKVSDTLYDVLKGKKVSAETVINLPNAEIRRAVIEIIGMEKFIKDAKPDVLDDNEIHGSLLKVKLEGDEDLTLLHVKDPSTTREYFLRVPPNMKTSAQARAWTFGIEEKDFNLIKET